MTDWKASGISNFRLEFVHETLEQVQQITQTFQKFLRGEINSQSLEQEINRHATTGTTDGSLFVPKDFKQLVQLG